MDFYDKLTKRGLLSILRHEEYEPPTMDGWPKVRDFLMDIVQNNRSVYIEGDYDVDGLCCTLTLLEGFKGLGVEDITVYEYRERTHAVDRVAIQQCIQRHCDYFIIADTGSNDLGLLQKLNRYGIKVIVLDHHITELRYDDFGDDIAIINTELETERLELSAGALCFIVIDLLYRELGKKSPQSLAAFAMVSLIADVIPMANPLNRGLYYYAVEQDEAELPPQVLYFKGQYSRFNTRYVGYWFSPRVNACFRAEKFDVLNRLFFRKLNAMEMNDVIEEVEEIYEASRNLVRLLSDLVENYAVTLEHFVFVDLYKVKEQFDVMEGKLYNYTGLIANKLSERFGKTGVVICSMENYYKGSVRDQAGRDYLTIFKQLCFAGGHKAAFGIKVRQMELQSFLEDLKFIDKHYAVNSIADEPIIITVPEGELPDEDMIHDMSIYNEFASPGVPVVFLRKKMIGSLEERRTEFYYKYKWGNLEIQNDTRIPYGRTVVIKPIQSWKLKLLVQS